MIVCAGMKMLEKKLKSLLIVYYSMFEERNNSFRSCSKT